MHLLRKEGLGEVIKSHELLGKVSCCCETFRHKHVFANKHNVGNNHSARSEKSLQVFWKFGTTSVTGIHGNPETNSDLKLNFTLIFKLEHVLVGVDLHFSNGIKTSLNLSGDDREHLNRDTIELVETAPSARLG